MRWTVIYFDQRGHIINEIDFQENTDVDAIIFAEINSPRKVSHYKLINTELIK